jgi:hypothetical protein
MTVTIKTMTKLFGVTALGFALTLGACDKGQDQAAKGDDKKAPATDKAPSDGTAEGEGGGEAAPSLDPKVERAVTLANKISNDPAAADAILTEAGLDRAAFEALLYEIARDPELSKSYAVARDA